MYTRIDMQTHDGRTLRLGLWFDLWPFDLRVSACRGPAVDYKIMYTDFGADSSSRFPFSARISIQTNRQTDATERPTAIQPTWVNKHRKCWGEFAIAFIRLNNECSWWNQDQNLMRILILINQSSYTAFFSLLWTLN